MRILVTGGAGHLGEGLVRTLRAAGRDVRSVDLLPSPWVTDVGTIVDRAFVRRVMAGVDAVLHTATLHKPHVATHARQDFVDTNITGTLHLLEEAHAAGVRAFVFTSTTSAFGAALNPPEGAPAAWITEDVAPVPKNVYGVTKSAAEDLCALFWRKQRMPCVVLRTSRFFREADDDRERRDAYVDGNLKASEYLFRRVDLEDVVTAHMCAIERATAIGFGRYIVSATTPFARADCAALRADAPSVVARYVPDYADAYVRRGWVMFPSIDRVYDNARARADLGWAPRYDFARVIARIEAGQSMYSPLALDVGTKPYHAETFTDGPYPVA